MKSRLFPLYIILLLSGPFTMQGQNSRGDQAELKAHFNSFFEADRDSAHLLLPALRKTFINELSAEGSFTNEYDSLSEYVVVKYAQDSLLKTFCWDERNGGCCYTSSCFAQYKSSDGKVHLYDLEEANGIRGEIYVKQVHQISINQERHYLILGWGSCCGGKQFEVARVYRFKDGDLIKLDAFKKPHKELYIGANRSQEIKLNYQPQSKTLSYTSYILEEDTGFYSDTSKMKQWLLEPNGFKQLIDATH
ncbi:MAG: hypothetical protein NXI09_05770 [Bacteroidetes bacterium]|nr:hypothetical protein [Bacteroidota bacterium]